MGRPIEIAMAQGETDEKGADSVEEILRRGKSYLWQSERGSLQVFRTGVKAGTV